MTQQAEQKVGQVAQQVQQQAEPLVHKAEQQVGGLTQKARQQATSRAEAQKNQVATRLTTVADAVDKVGQQLQQQHQDSLAHYVDMTSQQFRTVSDKLQQKDVNQLVHDAEGAIRKQPALVVGGAFALGLLAARFLKSSPPQTQQSQTQQQAPRDAQSHVADTAYPKVDRPSEVVEG
jgi:phage-related minor tail protein